MLQSLHIDNYALISHLELNLSQGMTVITGETGAGKSIIMGALSLILGGRAESKTVRAGQTKCVIEATFDIARYGLESFFLSNDLEYDPEATIIRREIYATGKSRAFINDSPVQLSTLKELSDALIDIHSQHQNLLLDKDSFRQEVIDTLADNADLLDSYKAQYRELIGERKHLVQLREEMNRSRGEEDYLRFQLAQLEEARLKEGEQEELESEQELLTHAEEIKSDLLSLSDMLAGDGHNVVQTLKQALQTARRLQTVYPDIQEITNRLESDYIDLKDIAVDVVDRSEEVNFDPDRSVVVAERLDLIYTLQKKHSKSSVEELLKLQAEISHRLSLIDHSDEEIETLVHRIEQLTRQLSETATSLTASRQKAAESFEKALVEKAAYMGMPNIRFKVDISPATDFTPTGADVITFLFSANKNLPLRPAGEIASGGEISRLMLSIKSLVASAKTLPTIIFDEIDTGVSGEMADRMGEVMKQLSQHLQVITITHLPQVAGKGNSHYKVYKTDDVDATTTHIVALEGEERIHEIARMLSGSQLTEQAIENARVLMSL